MDPAHQRLEFLDLSQASAPEIRLIERVLFSTEGDLRLPWVTEKHVDEEVVVEEEVVEDPEQAPAEGWVPLQYDEQQMPPEGSLEQAAPPPRGVFQTPPYMVYYVPPYSTQYGYSEELQVRPGPQRPFKKGDKKMEQQLYTPMQYVVSYPPMYPTGPLPFVHHVPFFPECHQQYIQSPEQGGYPEEAPYVPAPTTVVEIPPPEVKQENNTQVPVTEFQPHEHLCYHTDVTVKAPKRRPPEEFVESVAEPIVAAAPPVPMVNQPPPPVPISVVAQPVSVPVVLPPVTPVPQTVRNVPERTLDPQGEAKPRVAEYANAVRGDVPETVVEPPSSEPPAPRVDYSEPVYEEAKHPRGRTEYPDLPGPASAPPAAHAAKSWAGLFVASPGSQPVMTDVKSRPLARVLPFDLSQSATRSQESTPTAPAVNSVSATFPSHNNDYKSLDDPYTVRLGENLRGYQLDHRAVSLTPRGLTNRSNWCYVNAILQALIACPSFYNLLKALPLPQDAKQAIRTPIIGAMVELAQSFPPLVTGVRTKRRDKHGRDEGGDLPTGSSFEPAGVYKVLDKVRGDSAFSVEGRQEDAEEFLSCLLNGLNDEMFEVLKLVGGGDAEVPNGDVGQEPEGGEGWKVMGPKNKGAVTRRAVCGKTPVSDIFRGQLRSRVQRAGDEYTDNVQPFFTLQLDVEKASSVKEALELLVGKDPLEGMTCSRTHQEIEAWTQTTLEDLPLILILHLKCFDYKQDGCSKITKTVDFTVDLKVEPKLMSVNKNKYSVKQRNYKLVAVVYHDGKEATKGHYITDAYHVGLACWIRYDDGNVKRVREEQVLKPVTPRVPYLLYYRRTDTMSKS